MKDRGQLPTEAIDPTTGELSRLGALAAVDLMLAADAGLLAAVAAARVEIAGAVELIAARLARGGRLFYVGAGTSGRLGLLDAVECPPTFQSAPEQVQAVLAGGPAALLGAVEGAEDDREAAAGELARRELGPLDAVVAISAGGTTPFAHGAIDAARAVGAAAVFFACVARDDVPDEAEVSIRVVTGPEVLAGSTRLRAGTATKLVLNMLSTLSMARLGKLHGNLMVDVNTRTNTKLVDRGVRLVTLLVGCQRERGAELLEAAGGAVKLAVVMGSLGLERAEAERCLAAADGFLERALSGSARSEES